MNNSTFEIALWHGIWRVTLDGRFYGDYRTKGLALEGAEEARRVMVAAGRSTTIVFAEEYPWT